MLPPFDDEGNLPAGEHLASWLEFTSRFDLNPRRHRLLGGLTLALQALREAGCARVFVDGSFVTDKPEPGDIDLAYDTARLNWIVLAQLEPALIDLSNGRAAQKRKFGCECFPAEWAADLNGEPFRSFFQRDREGRRKGIVILTLVEVS